jgi:hypothetical protein
MGKLRSEPGDVHAILAEVETLINQADDHERGTGAFETALDQAYKDSSRFVHVKDYPRHAWEMLGQFLLAAPNAQSTEVEVWICKMVRCVADILLSSRRDNGLSGLIPYTHLAYRVLLQYQIKPERRAEWLNRIVEQLLLPEITAEVQVRGAKELQKLEEENGFQAFLTFQKRSWAAQLAQEDGWSGGKARYEGAPILVRQ